MKSRLILIVAAALLAAIPFLIFFRGEKAADDIPESEAVEPAPAPAGEKQAFRFRTKANPAEPQSAEAGKTPGESVSSLAPPQPENAGQKPADSSKAVARAVEAVRAGSPAEKPEPGTGDEIPEGAMKVGLVTGQSKLSPELADLAQKGAVAVAAKKWKEARDLYLEMVKQAPENALAYANLGVAEHQLGNHLAAAGNLRRSLEINPSIASNWQTLGLIHYERGELEMAISTLTRAIHENPSDARSRLYLAAVVREYGWIEASIIELQRAVETDPELADAHYNLAVTYLETKPPRLELARRHYYAAVDLGADPSPEMESAFAQKEE